MVGPWHGCPRARLWAVAAAALCQHLACGSAPPGVATWPGDQPFTPVGRRNDWCGILGTPGNSSQMKLALAGRNLSVNIDLTGLPAGFDLVTVDWSKHAVSSGYLVEVLDEMASRGGFTWRNSFTVTNVGQLHFDDFLQWSTENYDILVTYITSTPERIGRGVFFLYPLFDSSFVMIIRPEHSEPEWYRVLFGFLRPFAPKVWLGLILVAMITAVMYKYIERGNEDFNEEAVGDGPPCMQSLYLTLLTFAAGGSFSPSTAPGKFYNVAFTSVVLVVVAAYTANLASLLVVRGTKVALVKSLAEAATQRLPVCTNIAHMLPHVLNVTGLQVINTRNHMETYALVRERKCAIGITRHFLWKVLQRTNAANPGCKLVELPQRLLRAWSSFALKQDGASLCTDDMAQVLNLLLIDMFNSGFFAALFDKYLKRSATNTCTAGWPEASGDDAESLDLKSFGGIFLLYGLATLLAVGCRKLSCKTHHALVVDSGGEAESGKTA